MLLTCRRDRRKALQRLVTSRNVYKSPTTAAKLRILTIPAILSSALCEVLALLTKLGLPIILVEVALVGVALV